MIIAQNKKKYKYSGQKNKIKVKYLHERFYGRGNKRSKKGI